MRLIIRENPDAASEYIVNYIISMPHSDSHFIQSTSCHLALSFVLTSVSLLSPRHVTSIQPSLPPYHLSPTLILTSLIPIPIDQPQLTSLRPNQTLQSYPRTPFRSRPPHRLQPSRHLPPSRRRLQSRPHLLRKCRDLQHGSSLHHPTIPNPLRPS